MEPGTENIKILPPTPEVKIQVDFGVGRWGKTFHIFDLDGREISLQQKEACAMARKILAIAQGKESK